MLAADFNSVIFPAVERAHLGVRFGEANPDAMTFVWSKITAVFYAHAVFLVVLGMAEIEGVSLGQVFMVHDLSNLDGKLHSIPDGWKVFEEDSARLLKIVGAFDDKGATAPRSFIG